jgi:1-acyl-sn-glycerol-3-phosphate acyltransferase
MIQAKHHWWAQAFFYSYIALILRRDFSAFRICGEPPALPSDRALMAVPNHIGWWDGFFIHTLNRALWRRRFYLMMLEDQLKRYRFFRHLGVYSIDPSSPGATRESMEYSLGLLSDPAHMVVIYPEGELRSQFHPPANLKRGAEWLARRVSAERGGSTAGTAGSSGLRPFTALPVTFLVQPWDSRKPEILARCGEPIPSEELAASPDSLKTGMRENWNRTVECARTRSFSHSLFGREAAAS